MKNVVLLGLSLMVLMAGAAQATNLLYNGGFEAGFPTAPDGWYYGAGWFPSQTYPNVADVHSGMASAGFGTNAAWGDYWLASQWIDVNPGDPISFSVWKKNSGYQDGWGLTLQFNEFGTAGNFLRTQVGALHTGDTATWQLISDNFVISPDADAVMINIKYNGGGGSTTYLDDASFAVTPEPVSCLLLVGGGVFMGVRRKI